MVTTTGNPDSRTTSKTEYSRIMARKYRTTEAGARQNRLYNRRKSSQKYFEQSILEMGYPEYLTKEEWTAVRRNYTDTGKKLNEYELGKLLGWDKGV